MYIIYIRICPIIFEETVESVDWQWQKAYLGGFTVAWSGNEMKCNEMLNISSYHIGIQ